MIRPAISAFGVLLSLTSLLSGRFFMGKTWREAFLIHTVRTRDSLSSSAHILEGYKDAVRVALADGFVTREEMQQLPALRHQLAITQEDHECLMAEFAAEVRDPRSHAAR